MERTAPLKERSCGLKPYSMGEYKDAPSGARRLHLNEFRYPHAPGVLAALEQAAARLGPERALAEYPAGADPGLVADLAAYVGVAPASVLVTPGSDEALRAVIDTAAARGLRTAVMGVPGYTHFDHFVRLRGLELATYAIGLGTPAAHHEAALLYHEPLLSAGALVYLCSPNNPTGDLWAGDAVAGLARRFPRSLFLVDEAYTEFAAHSDCGVGFGLAARLDGAAKARGISLDAYFRQLQAKRSVKRATLIGERVEAGDFADTEQPARAVGRALDSAAMNLSSVISSTLWLPNVVVSRTLSKAFGLATLRVGYLVGEAELVAELRVAVNPKSNNPQSALVARAALRELDYYGSAALSARLEGARAVLGLRAAGWHAVETPANFFLVHVGGATAAAAAALAAAGVLVRDRGEQPGLAGFVRVTAGTPADTDATLAAFAAIAAAHLPREPPIQALYTDKLRVAQVKGLVRATARVLRAAGLEFFATSGTLLGMARHGGMIPWDDDADLAYVRDPHRDQVRDLVPAFRAQGLTCQRNRTDAYWQIGTNPPGMPISPAHVDLFSFRAVFRSFRGGPGVVIRPEFAEEANSCGAFGGGHVSYELDDVRFREEEPNSANAECNIKCQYDELYPLDTSNIYTFYDLSIPVPRLAGHLLARSLGEDFETCAKIRTPSGLVTRTVTDSSAA